MSNKTRKRIWPGALVMSIAIVGVLAAFVVLATNSGSSSAHDGASGSTHCDDLTAFGRIGHDNDPNNDHDCATGPAATPDPTPGNGNGNGSNGGGDADETGSVTSSSTSGSSTVELRLTIENLAHDVPVGGAIMLYLEDDYQEPDSIPAGAAYFVSEPARVITGNSARVYSMVPPVIDTDDHFTADKKDIDIEVLVPDMCTNATDECEGDNGLMQGDTVTLVMTKAAGIKNPSEEGTHSTGYSVHDATGKALTGFTATNTLGTLAKISLSDVDNSRGYEMTVTGSGFNNGTSAAAYVLHDPSVGSVPSGDAEAALCERIIRTGTNVGDAIVGSDDKVAITFEVTAPTFGPGNNNYICMVDGEGRMSSTDVEDFKLEPSIKVVPDSVNSGDTVNVFAQDYPAGIGGLAFVKIANEPIPGATGGTIQSDGSGTATFEVPGGLEGVLRIDAAWGVDANGNNKCDSGERCVNEDSKITIAGAELNASKTDVLPNETITITGNGFGTQTCIARGNITLDAVSVVVHEDSLADRCGGNGVEVSNSGQFVATIILWPAGSGSNPTLIPGIHELSVTDSADYGASVDISIAEPTVTVTPDVAGPRDYITITGENWPVDNPDANRTVRIELEIDDVTGGREYTLFADAVGRVSQEHRVHRDVSIPSTVQVKMTHGDVAKIGSFAVPASTIEISPDEGQPGDTITLSAGNMKVYTEVDYIEIGGTRYDDPGVNTDRDGNVTVEDVLIPGLDPGVYSVVINVDGTIAIGEVNVLAESSAAGAPAMLPDAVDGLGDSLVAIFHFDDVGKVWSFHDPRPEFSDLNTLTEMVNGEAYWILVDETVEDVVLNNKVRSLTCRGDDCWNLEVW